ncbi:MAG: hypothetical protein ACHQ15_00630 [Candidatus Limnocylindrales bacterium]
MHSEGGFIGPTATLAALPSVVVYDDGRIFLPGAVDTIYPAPLLPTFSVHSVGAAGVQAIRDALRSAGLDVAGGGDTGVAADTGTTVFEVVVNGQTVTTRFANTGGGPRPGGSPAPAALDLLSRLTDPTETWGSTATQATLYPPTAYRVYTVPGAPAADPAAPQTPMAWPLTTGLDAFGVPAPVDRGIVGLRVGVVSGADAAVLAAFLAKANVLTPVTSAGQSYTLYVRPLLPDESPGA